MLRRPLHIAVVTLVLFASSAAAIPTELSKPSAERTALAELWQKVVSLLDFDREASPAPEPRAKNGGGSPTGDHDTAQPLIGAVRVTIIPNG